MVPFVFPLGLKLWKGEGCISSSKIPFRIECEFRHLASKHGTMLMSRWVQVYQRSLFKHEWAAAVERWLQKDKAS
ncbi:hypothetical protein MKW98_012663 [Papaver atlanticum]|uniref:Uncharacterized protein n=1 Tax=Papaver atlanticum TaxID=357466 RepID=A0AAD4XMD1_9MAGN|nr:hypothetical protein MKW98_012663 [Papaver atlanticum]